MYECSLKRQVKTIDSSIAVANILVLVKYIQYLDERRYLPHLVHPGLNYITISTKNVLHIDVVLKLHIPVHQLRYSCSNDNVLRPYMLTAKQAV